MVPQRLRLLRWYRGALRPGEPTPLKLLMVQSTTFCNIDCSYCYLPNRDRKGRFDLQRLPLLFRKLDAAGLLAGELSIVWHAGEPLVLPADYYREAFEIVRRCVGERIRVRHSFQTNAMLVTEDHCRLFRDWDTNVGVSIDGPAHLHDVFRVTRTGAGTHAQAMKGIELLKDRGIPFGTISVVTSASVDRADEMFDFLAALRPREIGFNIDELEGENRESTLGDGQGEARFRDFMGRVLARALADPGAPPVRELTHAFSAVQGSVFRNGTTSTEANPMSILSVGIDGRLATYSPELLDARHPVFGDISFGTVDSVDFATLFDSPGFRRVQDEIDRGIEMCKQGCGYFDVCGGGAPSNKLAEHGTFAAGETMFCRMKYMVTTDIAHEHVARRLADVAAGRQAARQPLAAGK